MKAKVFLFLLLVGINYTSCNSGAQVNSDKTSAQQPDAKEAIGYINTFFDKYKHEGPKPAIDYIFSKSNGTTITGIDALKSKIDSLKSTLGSFSGYEQIIEKNAANSLVLFSYLVKHENHPLRFTFVFYKPKDNWVLYKFSVDAEVENELEYSGKIYFIK